MVRFLVEDVASVPVENAKILVKQHLAEAVEVTYKLSRLRLWRFWLSSLITFAFVVSPERLAAQNHQRVRHYPCHRIQWTVVEVEHLHFV